MSRLARSRVAFLLLFVGLLAGCAPTAQESAPVKRGRVLAQSAGMLGPCGYQQLASLGSATGFTMPVSGGPDRVLIECDAAAGVSVRWRDDGVAPTATVGMELTAGSSILYEGSLSSIQFIGVSNGAVINAAFYR